MENINMDDARTPLISDFTPNQHSSSSPATTENMGIDEILETTGPFGKYQIIVQILMMYFSISISYQTVLSYFIGDNPPWKCANNNSSRFCVENYGREFSIDSRAFYERCNLTRDEWIYTTPDSYSYITEFDLVCKRKTVGALISAAFFIGGLIVPILTGMLTDFYGRKLILIFSLLCTIITSIACSFIENEWQLLGLRAAHGAAAFSSYANVILLMLEFMAPSCRAISASIYLIAFTISLLLIDLAAYFERNWRKLNAYAAIPSIFSLFLFFFISESPRWLLAKGKVSEAARILKNIANCNNKSIVLNSLKAPKNVCSERCTFVDLFRKCNVAFMTLSIGMIYGTMALVYYQVALESANLGGNIYQTFALAAVADVPSYFISVYLCNRFGRKKTVSVDLLLSGIAVGLIGLIPNSFPSRYVAKITLAIMSKVFVNIGLIGIYIWAFELFPTVVRSQGCNLCAGIEKIGGLLVPILAGALHSINPMLPYIIIGVTAVMTSLIALLLPETNKLPTRETIKDFTS